MRVFPICLIAFGLLAGTTAMAAGGDGANGSPTAANSPATAASASTAASPAAPASPAEARMEEELQQLRDLLVAQQKQFQQQNNELKQQLTEQEQKVEALEKQVTGAAHPNELASSPAPAAPAAATSSAASLRSTAPPSASTAAASPSISANGAAVSAAAAAPQGDTQSLADRKVYDGGFYVATEDQRYTMHINGLFQPRFTVFDANSNAVALGAAPGETANFDMYLGRLALSGSVFDPSIKYFVQFQGSTSSNTIGVNFIDWFAQKKFSDAFSIQMGRSWTPYSLENLDSPGQYLMADFSSAEYAFALSRAVGFEALGQIGKLGYAVMIANAVPGLDAAGQENFNSKLAYIGHVHYDFLKPYGYQESDPSPDGAPTELTLWTSVAYNPVLSSSAFSNESAGDSTVGATATLGFRKKYFGLQNTGFYRDTKQFTHAPSFNSWGFAEQAGYYLVPGHFEVTARVAGVNWGAEDFTGITPGFDTNTWYSGPNFPFHRVTEHTVGANYYLYGHHAKFQFDYSYLTGNTFANQGFGASRIWIQSQIQF